MWVYKNAPPPNKSLCDYTKMPPPNKGLCGYTENLPSNKSRFGYTENAPPPPMKVCVGIQKMPPTPHLKLALQVK